MTGVVEGSIDSSDLMAEEIAPVESSGLVMDSPTGSPSSTDPGIVSDVAERDIVKTAEVRLTSVDVQESLDAIAAIIAKDNGIVVDSYLQAYTEFDMEGRLSAKVAPSKLESILIEIGSNGTVTSENITTRDVTLENRNLDAQIQAAQASVERLEELLAQSGDLDSLLRIEVELSNRQANLDILKNQKTFLENQIQMSSLVVYVTSSVNNINEPVTNSPGFTAGLEQGLVEFKSNVSLWLTNFGKITPYLIFVVLPLLLISLIVVAVVKSRDNRKKTSSVETKDSSLS